MRRLVLVALAAGLLAAGGVAAANRAGQGGADEPDATAAPVETAKVERRDLQEVDLLSGTLGYAGERQLALGVDGTITALPEAGTVVKAGQALARVDDTPVLLLHGAVPAWRELSAAAEDGEDIRQLEENLVALGHAKRGAAMPDGDWSPATTAAVKALQKAHGLERSGRLELGRVVFAPGDVRVTALDKTAGQRVSAGEAVLTATSTEREVHTSLTAAQSTLLAVGDAVTVVLSGGTELPGTVRELGRGLEGTEDGESRRDAWISLKDIAAVEGIDTAPVDVRAARTMAQDVLAVPVHALLARADGSYTVEVAEGDATRVVPVELGVVADGWAEVRATDGGRLEQGDDVVVPA